MFSWYSLIIGVVVVLVLVAAVVGYLLYRGYKRIAAETNGDIPAPPFSHMLGHPEAMMHPCKHIYRGGLCDQVQVAFHQLVLMKRSIVFCNDATEAGKILNDIPTKGIIYSMFRLKPTVPDLMSAEGPDFDVRIQNLQRGLAAMALDKSCTVSADLLTVLKSASESGKPLDLAKLMKQAALDAISSSLFGYQLNAVTGSSEGEGLISAMNTRDDKMKSTGIFADPNNRKVPPEEELEAQTRWATYVMKLQAVVVSEALAHEKAKGELNRDKFSHSLVILARELHSSCASGEGELDLNKDPNIAAEIHCSLRHGFEAIAGTLTWILYLLYRYPQCRAKLEKALVLEDKAGPKTEYLEWVVRETMRRNPVMGNFTQRWVTQKGYRVKGPNGGYEVPIQQPDGGTAINVGIFPLHNTNRTWSGKSNDFDPERWSGAGSKVDGVNASFPNCPFLSKGQTQTCRDPRNEIFSGVGFKENSLSFFPFSAGTRICKGKDFALEVIRQVVADVCSAYRLDCSAPEELPEDPGASYFSSIVPVLPAAMQVVATRLTEPGVVPKKAKPQHGWAKDDSDEETEDK